jgi:hypothetical protein
LRYQPSRLTSVQTYTPPGALGSRACAADTCCVWDFVAKDLVELFTGADGQCNDFARASIRLGFHDAGAWSKTSGSGGADGSLVLSVDEITRSENNGMQTIRIEALKILAKYASFGVGGADLVQFMHNIATVVCPLGPRQITFVGRNDALTSNPPGLLPDTHASAPSLIQLFADKTFTVIDLIALIGAHTTAKQRFVDTSKAGQPLDSTPGVWDVAFYGETLNAQPDGVFRLPSDDAFAKDPTSTRGFTVFSDPLTGQANWNALYAKAYTRLSLLGVNKINQLVDCTKVLPNAILVVPPPVASSSSSSVASHASTSSKYSYSHYPSGSASKSYSEPMTTSTICVTETYVDKTKTITTTIPLMTTVCPVSTSTPSAGKPTITVWATKTFTVTYGVHTKTITTSFPVKPTHSKGAKPSSTPNAPIKVVTSSTPAAPVKPATTAYNYEAACVPMPTVTTTKIVWV